MYYRKILCFATLFFLFFSFSIYASAANDLAKLDIIIPEELQKFIDEADTKELAEEIKEKLDSFENLSDEEILDITHQLCDRWSIQMSEEQMEKAAEYIKKARDFDIQDVEQKIDEVKTKVTAAQRFFAFVADTIGKLTELISMALNSLGRFFESLG